MNGWREYFCYGYNVNLAAGVGTTFTDGNIRIDSDADFELHKITYHATNGNIRLRMRDDAMGRYFIRDATDLRTMGGNFAGTPFHLPRPLTVLAGTNVTIEAADSSGIANTLRLVLHGAKIRPGMCPWEPLRKFRAILPFSYTTGRGTIPANATVSIRIEIDTDAHFLVEKVTGFKIGNCLIDVKESARDKDWFNTAVPFDTVVGNGQFPNNLFANRFVPRGSVIVITAQDLSGAANTGEIVLWGSKLFE